MNKNYLIKLLTATISGALLSLAAAHSVLADNTLSSWRDDPLQLNVRFERRVSAFNQFGQTDGSAAGNGWENEFDNFAGSAKNTKYSLGTKMLSQYDATFFFPFQRGKFNFDLGLNIKFINGITESTDASGAVTSKSYKATLPMMYATALYELPWKGLSAGIEGKHMVLDNSSAYDYKAMLTYQSRSGFGLNGGWQYQQLQLDAFQNITATSQTDGPFVDFYYNF